MAMKKSKPQIIHMKDFELTDCPKSNCNTYIYVTNITTE